MAESAKVGPPSLFELCIRVIAKNLHTYKSLDILPPHIKQDVLERRKNESLTDDDLPLLLATTIEAYDSPAAVDFLTFRSCLKITDIGFERVFKSLPGLTALDLSFCECLGDPSLTAMGTHLTGITSLDLTGCRAITDAGCTQGLARLKGLRVLSLELCNKVSDIGVQAVVRAAGPRLEELNLGDVRGMSNVSVQIIADHCKGLTSLSIAGNMQVLDMDVGDVCKAAAGLQSLNLRACRRLTDAALRPVAALLRAQARRGAPPLTALDLGGCGRITDGGLAALLPHASSLTLLDLRGCKELTARSKELIDTHCPAMQHLTLPTLAAA